MKFSFYTFLLFLGGVSSTVFASEFYCKYCGDSFSNAYSTRTGYCMYSAARKHTVIICKNKKFICERCGESFSYPGAVRTGTCLYSSNRKHVLSGGSEGRGGRATQYICRFCGEIFSNASTVRAGTCLYAPSGRKHRLAGEMYNGRKLYCAFCGESFSYPGSVRAGTCLYSKNKKHQLP